MQPPTTREWLEADGLGGYASGNDDGTRSRRYHAWLLCATAPPAGRRVLVNGADAIVTTPSGTFAISGQRYRDGVLAPDGPTRLRTFRAEPWPTWTYALDGDTRIVHELFVPHAHAAAVSTWRLVNARDGVTLRVRPFLSGRDHHALRGKGSAAPVQETSAPGGVTWRFRELPAEVRALHNGAYQEESYEYEAFDYEVERQRGYDSREDLASPGFFTFDLSSGEACLLFAASTPGDVLPAGDVRTVVDTLRLRERARRSAFASRLHRAADAYVVRRGTGKTIIAGYPWFADWGRDTFLSLRGLCIAADRLADARDILCEWARHVSRGMLPNRFPDGEGAPEFNSADAALWFVVAAHELLTHAHGGAVLHRRQRAMLHDAILAIVAGYCRGTRHGIARGGDHLLAAGEPGVQLTWMDAKVGDSVVTPRTGKPVELQALWCNALAAAAAIEPEWRHELLRATAAFEARFWSDRRGYLLDVADSEHVPGQDDDSFRPNQILAVGGLPFRLLDGARARAVVDAVEARLLTPLGLRTLAVDDPRYAGRYAGGPRTRDAAYHNGTVWPWLLGPFVEAWVRVRGSTRQAIDEARIRFLRPLLDHLDGAGLGHISEVADGDAPHAAGGCPFQAWSVGEALRLQEVVLRAAPDGAPGAHRGLATSVTPSTNP